MSSPPTTTCAITCQSNPTTVTLGSVNTARNGSPDQAQATVSYCESDSSDLPEHDRLYRAGCHLIRDMVPEIEDLYNCDIDDQAIFETLRINRDVLQEAAEYCRKIARWLRPLLHIYRNLKIAGAMSNEEVELNSFTEGRDRFLPDWQKNEWMETTRFANHRFETRDTLIDVFDEAHSIVDDAFMMHMSNRDSEMEDRDSEME